MWSKPTRRSLQKHRRSGLRRGVREADRKPHAITFTSSSTVKNFVGLLGLRGARAALEASLP